MDRHIVGDVLGIVIVREGMVNDIVICAESKDQQQDCWRDAKPEGFSPRRVGSLISSHLDYCEVSARGFPGFRLSSQSLGAGHRVRKILGQQDNFGSDPGKPSSPSFNHSVIDC